MKKYFISLLSAALLLISPMANAIPQKGEQLTDGTMYYQVYFNSFGTYKLKVINPVNYDGATAEQIQAWNELTDITVPGEFTLGEYTYLVDSVATGAFAEHANLQSATFGGGVGNELVFGPRSFYKCPKLTTLTIEFQNSIRFQEYSFSECTSLKNLNYRSLSFYAFEGAFKGCWGLNSTACYESVLDLSKARHLGKDAFNGVLRYIVLLPKNISSIDYNVFDDWAAENTQFVISAQCGDLSGSDIESYAEKENSFAEAYLDKGTERFDVQGTYEIPELDWRVEDTELNIQEGDSLFWYKPAFTHVPTCNEPWFSVNADYVENLTFKFQNAYNEWIIRQTVPFGYYEYDGQKYHSTEKIPLGSGKLTFVYSPLIRDIEVSGVKIPKVGEKVDSTRTATIPSWAHYKLGDVKLYTESGSAIPTEKLQPSTTYQLRVTLATKYSSYRFPVGSASEKAAQINSALINGEDAQLVGSSSSSMFTMYITFTTGADANMLAAPTFSREQAWINNFEDVTLTAESGADIYYTLDGSEPSATNGTLFTEPIRVNVTKENEETTLTIKAVAIKDGKSSEVVAKGYYLHRNAYQIVVLEPEYVDITIDAEKNEIGNVKYGDPVTINAVAKDGYEISAYYAFGVSNLPLESNTFIMPNNSVTIKVLCKKLPTYKVTLGETVKCLTEGVDLDAVIGGTKLILTADYDKECKWMDWNLDYELGQYTCLNDESVCDTIEVPVNSDIEITTFSVGLDREFILRTAEGTEGTVSLKYTTNTNTERTMTSPQESLANYFGCGEVEIWATPAEGWEFDHITVNGEEKTEEHFIIDAVKSDLQVTGYFREVHEGIEDVRNAGVQCMKELRNGVLYIERNGKTYNAQGAEVK